MPAKKDLAAQPGETPATPLRRGRGLRLSRAAKQSRNRSSDAGAQLDPPARAAIPSVEPLAAAIEAHGQAAAPFELAQPEPVYEKRKLKLRKDLLQQAKRIARTQDRKLYQVIEAALESYIERHGAGE